MSLQEVLIMAYMNVLQARYPPVLSPQSVRASYNEFATDDRWKGITLLPARISTVDAGELQHVPVSPFAVFVLRFFCF
jgi:hypothetical protein